MQSLWNRKRLIPAALLFLGLGFGSDLKAQTTSLPTWADSIATPDAVLPPPPPPPPGGPDQRPGPADGPDRGDRRRRGPGERPVPSGQLSAMATFSGTVIRAISNDDFVYDGFTLKTASDSFHVHFPPSLGDRLQKSLRTGGSVSVTGVERRNPEADKEIEMVTITANGNVYETQPPSTPPVPSAETYTKGNGKITGLGTDRESRINAIVVDGKKILRLPPGAFAGLPQPPALGDQISFTGTNKTAGAGEWVAGDTKVIRIRTITLHGQQYLVGPR